MLNILFLTNIPSPYRVKFFSQLGKKCNLTVLYEMKRATNRDKDWKEEYTPTFHEIYMHTHQLIDDGGISTDIFHYLKRNQYDFIIVGTHGTPTAKLAMLYMRLCRIPYILNIDGMLSAEIPEKSKLNGFLRRMMFQGAAAYITSGKDTMKYLHDLGVKSPHMYKYHFSSIVEQDVLKRPVSDEEKGRLKKALQISEPRMIVSVARFIPQKGLDTLIRAFSELSSLDVALVLIGGSRDVYTSFLDTLPEGVFSKIYFPGFMNKAKLYQYYKAADLFVLPTHHDAWGLVINEALSCGLPVITTNRCGAGLETITPGENGFIVEHTDLEALKTTLDSLLENPDLRLHMASQNLKLAHEYTIEKMVEDHLRIFQKLSSNK